MVDQGFIYHSKRYKHMSTEGDIVLIHYQDRPAMYARIEAIEPDIKKGWYQVTLLLLTIPQQIATWILREEYINGAPFTLGEKAMMLKKVERVQTKGRAAGTSQQKGIKAKGKRGKVIPFKPPPE
jgi:hypothetical protein